MSSLVLLAGCSGTTEPRALEDNPTTRQRTVTPSTLVATLPDDGSFVSGEPDGSFVSGEPDDGDLVFADPVVDFVSDPSGDELLLPDVVYTLPPESAPQTAVTSVAAPVEPPAAAPATPSTAPADSVAPQPSADFSLPASPTIPKLFEPADIKLARNESVDGIGFGVPAGWVVFSTPEEVAASPALSAELRTTFSQGLEADPNRRYLIPKADLSSVTPTWALISVTAPTALSAQEISTRIEQFAVQMEGLRVAARARRPWLDKRGNALLLRGDESRRRLVITARLADQRAVSVATEGRGDDLASLHALLVLSVVPGPAPAV